MYRNVTGIPASGGCFFVFLSYCLATFCQTFPGQHSRATFPGNIPGQHFARHFPGNLFKKSISDLVDLQIDLHMKAKVGLI
jgi:hypothetical protein